MFTLIWPRYRTQVWLLIILLIILIPVPIAFFGVAVLSHAVLFTTIILIAIGALARKWQDEHFTAWLFTCLTHFLVGLTILLQNSKELPEYTQVTAFLALLCCIAALCEVPKILAKE